MASKRHDDVEIAHRLDSWGSFNAVQRIILQATHPGGVGRRSRLSLRIGAFESMAEFSWTEPMLASDFLAITPRTAGYNTVDTGALTDLSLFITIILMFVGASPGIAGGA